MKGGRRAGSAGHAVSRREFTPSGVRGADASACETPESALSSSFRVPVRRFSCHSGPGCPARFAYAPSIRAGRCIVTIRGCAVDRLPGTHDLRPGVERPYPVAEREHILYTGFPTERPNISIRCSPTAGRAELPVPDRRAAMRCHYLKRPIALEPATARPCRACAGSTLAAASMLNADPAKVVRYRGQVRIRPGIPYQPHPAFALDEDGSPPISAFGEADLRAVRSRRLRRDRHARAPGARLRSIRSSVSPIRARTRRFELSGGVPAHPGAVRLAAATKMRAERAVRAAVDDPPGWLISDCCVTGRGQVTPLRITPAGRLNRSSAAWLSGTFAGPVPHWWTLHGRRGRRNHPTGGGGHQAYMQFENNPNAHGAGATRTKWRPYPCAGEPGDAEAGLLADCGKPMPFIDRWCSRASARAFPTGTSSCRATTIASGVSSDNFDQAVSLTSQGARSRCRTTCATRASACSPRCRRRSSTSASTMLDPLVGGGASKADKARAKLRQAISIALDMEFRVGSSSTAAACRG